jgi:hypothetical protein
LVDLCCTFRFQASAIITLILWVIDAVGLDFKVDTNDPRFAAVLDSTDNRFIIDRTNPQFKETPAAMRELLAEQTKRRESRVMILVQKQ